MDKRKETKELAADGTVEVPRALLYALRTHLDIISSFQEWEEAEDPVGPCVKAASAKGVRVLTEAIAYVTGREKGPIFRMMKCRCYSPVHDQMYGMIAHLRPHLRRKYKDSFMWKCAICERQVHYEPPYTIIKGGISSYRDY